MEINVVAITVTYNRVNTLLKTIRALINQNYNKLDKIIIVDNNSSVENIRKIDEMKKLDERIEVLYLNKNLGGAGGFENGVRYAKEKYNAKWYWIMDDDAYPTVNCLSNLMVKTKKLNNIGFLAPLIYGITLEEYQLYHHKRIDKNLKEYSIYNNYDEIDTISNIDANAFVGPLISQEAIERVGYPDGNLFIYGDDTEYTYRITQSGLEGYLVKEAIINHEDPPQDKGISLPTHWWKNYYSIRNQYFFINKFGKNKLYIIKSKCKLTINTIKSILVTFIKIDYRNYRVIRIRLLIKAIIDGLFNITGKNLDPVVYIGKINDIK